MTLWGLRATLGTSVKMTETASLVPLKDIFGRALELTSGRWRPANMTEERQREFLAENERLHPGGAAWAAKILDGYELGGAP